MRSKQTTIDKKLQLMLLVSILFFLIITPFLTYISGHDTLESSLIYSTLLGGANTDLGTAIMQDSQGNIIIAGITYSSDFPVTSNAYDPTHNGGADVFVSKFSPDGTTLLYSTFIGGSADELHYWSTEWWSSQVSIAVDSSDNIIIHGPTHSTDFPITPGAYDETYNGALIDGENQTGDMFVCKLAANGSTLLFSTFLGGCSAEENAKTIAIDEADNIYLSGLTSSRDFPTTSDALYPTQIGEWDIFIAKLAANGSSLLYSTYFGGTGLDLGVVIKLDGNNNIYIGGATYSTDFPTTVNAIDPDVTVESQNGFIAKISQNGTELLYSTYIHCSNGVSVHDLAIDNLGTMYIAGIAKSAGLMTTSQAFDNTFNGGGGDGFFTKITSNGSLLYSTYLGGTENDNFFKMLLDSNKSVYLFGASYSEDYPTTLNAYASTNAGEWDYIIMKIPNNGSCLLYSSYLGGSGHEPDIWQDRPQHTYPDFLLRDTNSVGMVGTTNSVNYPLTVNAINQSLNGDSDISLSYLNFTELPTPPPITTTTLETTITTKTTTDTSVASPFPNSLSILMCLTILSILKKRD